MRFISFILCLLLTTACSSNCHVSVRTDYLTKQALASYQVKTPDPRLNNPSVGQRLIISWKFPSYYLNYKNFHFRLTVRFTNCSQITENICIKDRWSTYVFALLNEDFFEKKGIRSYKIEVIGDDKVLEEWHHHLWVELISFEEEPKEACEENDAS